MTPSIEVPREIVQAASLGFKSMVSGFLWRAFAHGRCLGGEIYGDLSERFSEGGLIQTSAIMQLTREHGYLLAHTFTGSCYVLVQPAGSVEQNFGHLYTHEVPQGLED
ncbi:hypothetical protein ACIQRH_01395 [Pseudomonas sp. NPDC090964]|uniref:hypothetical protein n=1 Tax=Pseudomonas TaxID=286 RepID=UPI0013730009|nr:hypothetical protein [Pseudomonas syringae]NAS95246.1 hypothetical protein [Pseudomonas syringae pv. actinidifoliorum]NAT63351.1 hypothetical protein [Pseudomonas syringae pv. actinidifoliorum]